MATQRKVRQYATYGNVAYKVDNTAPARERRREVEQPRRPRVRPRERVATLARLIDPGNTIHDLRMVPGPTHTNVIFDAVVPYGCPLSDQEVARRVQEGVRALDGNYFAVVEVEKSYV